MKGHHIWSRRDGSDEGSPHMVSKRWFGLWVTTYGLEETVRMKGHHIWSRRDGSDEGSPHMVSKRRFG